MNDYQIVTVDAGNIQQYGFFCLNNKNRPGYSTKMAWLHKRIILEGYRARHES